MLAVRLRPKRWSWPSIILEIFRLSTRISFTNSSAVSLEKAMSNGWMIRLSMPAFSSRAAFSSMVLSNLRSLFCCKTIRGCGKKVSTTLSHPDDLLLFMSFSSMLLWPLCTPSKVPRVTMVLEVEVNSCIELKIFKPILYVSQI